MSSDRKHYARQSDPGKTLCGRVILRYDTKGALVSELSVTRSPYAITCIVCKTNPELDGLLGNMTHSGH